MIDESRYERFTFEREGDVLIVRFNRPEKLNAVDQKMHDEIHTIFYDLQFHDPCKVVVLSGEGRGFCAGGDVAAMDSPTGSGINRDWSLVNMDPPVLSQLLALDKPIISMVNGPAFGFGMNLALYCDIVVAAEDAKIADTHVVIGLVCGDGAAALWPLLIGPQKTKELLLLGEVVTGKHAAELGLATYAVPLEELREFTMKLAHRLAAMPAFAARATKQAVNRHIRHAMEHVQDAAFAWERISFTSQEHKDAARRFKESRKKK